MSEIKSFCISREGCAQSYASEELLMHVCTHASVVGPYKIFSLIRTHTYAFTSLKMGANSAESKIKHL